MFQRPGHKWLYLELEKYEKNPRDEKCSDRSSSKLSGLPTEIWPITENTSFGWKAHHWIRLGEEHAVMLNPKGPLFAPRPWFHLYFLDVYQKYVPREDLRAPNKSRSLIEKLEAALSAWICPLPLFQTGVSASHPELSSPWRLTALVWIWVVSRWVSPWRDGRLQC